MTMQIKVSIDYIHFKFALFTAYIKYIEANLTAGSSVCQWPRIRCCDGVVGDVSVPA